MRSIPPDQLRANAPCGPCKETQCDAGNQTHLGTEGTLPGQRHFEGIHQVKTGMRRLTDAHKTVLAEAFQLDGRFKFECW
mmetsp:Transcript_154351/g.474372  ORF Transcript_154351/g.474372 Transcript_154351/m.474372 type:complete len:80 (-) Transcript_154351:52-291(-)